MRKSKISKRETIGLLKYYNLYSEINKEYFKNFIKYLNATNFTIESVCWTDDNKNFLGIWWNNFNPLYRIKCSKFLSHFYLLYQSRHTNNKNNLETLNRLIRFKALEYKRESEFQINPEVILRAKLESTKNDAIKAFQLAETKIKLTF